MIELFYSPTPNGRKVSIMLEEIKIKYKITSVNLNNKLYNDRLSSDLIKYTDRIYYLDGIYDKLFYDTTLLNNPIIFTQDNDVEFSFNGCVFNKPDSVFVFNKPIDFVGGMWKNLFE